MGFLMKSQRADLFKVLEENHLNPADFEIVPSTAKALSHERGEQIRLRGTDYYFSVYPNESEYRREKFFVEFSPGEEKIHELDLCANWAFVCYKFVDYLSFLQREINTLDPWTEIEKLSETLKSLPEAPSDVPLDKVEQKRISKTLGEIEQMLLEHVEDSAEQTEYVKQQFKVLRDAITKFGRKDYLMLLYTTVIGVATTLRLPPNAGTQLLEALRQIIVHVPKLLT
jgi:hypothetical protein